MADSNNVPNRKVVVGTAVSGLIVFAAAILKKVWGFELEMHEWMGLQTVVVFIVQYAVPNAEV